MNVSAPFSAIDVSWNRFAENALPLQAVAGSTHIQLGPNFPGPEAPTGLAIATVYTATARIDGSNRAISVNGTAAQTIEDLVSEIDADLGAFATTVLDGDTIKITSLTTGASSTVFVSDTGSNFLFSSIRGGLTGSGSPAHFGVVDYDSTRGWNAIAGSTNRVGVSVKGNTKYLRFDKMSAAQQEDVATVIDDFLAAGAPNTNQPWLNAAASIAITAGFPTLLSDTTLSTSTVYQLRVNVNGAGNVTIFIDLKIPQTNDTTFDTLLAAINKGLADAVQSDGTPLPVVCEWRDGYNSTQQPRLYFRVLPSNTLFSPSATGAVLQGSTSSLVLTDGASNGIVAALDATAAYNAALDTSHFGYGIVNFNRVNAAAVVPGSVPAIGGGGTDYDFTVVLSDGGLTRTSYDVTVNIDDNDTMTVIAGKMQTALQATTADGDEEVFAVGNKLLISDSSSDPGFNTQVEVVIPTTSGVNPDLFQAIAAGFDVVDPRGDTDVTTFAVDGFATPGVDGSTNLSFPKTVDSIAYANWLAVLASSQVGGRSSGQFVHGPTGFGPLATSDGGASFEKENRPAARGQCVRGELYWDGAAWRYFVDGDISRAASSDTSAGTNNPPETLDSGV